MAALSKRHANPQPCQTRTKAGISTLHMLTHDQYSALEILRSRTWRSAGGLTWRSEKSRVKELCECLKDAPPQLLIPSLAATLINFPSDYRDILSEFVCKLIDQIPVERWSHLDQEIRSEFQSLQHQLQHLQRKERQPDLVLPLEQLIALCHPDGYTRQRAVESLQIPFPPALISLLILRCNDWVAPVKQVARERLFEQPFEVFKDRAGEVLTSLTLLRRSSRNQGTEIERYIDASILSNRESLEAVLSVLKCSQNKAKRKACSQFLLRHYEKLEPCDLDVFVSHGTSSDLGMLLRAARHFPNQDQKIILDRVKDSKLVALRRERLRLLGVFDCDGNQSEFIEALYDISRSIRTIARFHLKDWNDLRISKHYLSILTSNPGSRKFRGCLLGLSEVSSEQGHQFALRILATDPAISWKKTCIECLDLRSGDVADEKLVAWMASPTIAVSHACYRRIIAQKKQLPPKLLADLAGDLTLPEHSYQVVKKLLVQGHKWQTLPWLFKLAATQDGRFREQANTVLNQWLLDYGNSFVTPTGIEKKAIGDQFKINRNDLDSRLKNEFINLLKSFITL